MTETALVWDRKDSPTEDSGAVLYWQSYAGGDASIPRRLERNAEGVRARYLSFIHDLGESRIAGRSVVEHLALEDGFSFWWMTLTAEKSPFKSPRIYTCLRLLVLDDILRETRPARLILASSDAILAECVGALCRGLGIPFEWRKPEAAPRPWSPRRIYEVLPAPLRGLLSFAARLTRWPLRRLGKPRWFASDGAVFFCSYFAHLDAASCARGVFHSRQWGPLPGALHDAGRPSNWVHHFLTSRDVPDARTGVDWLARFNADAGGQGAHAFLETYLGAGVVARAFAGWLRRIATARRLGELSSGTGPAAAAWLWPALRDDWRASVSGPIAVSNCLWLELFDAALRDVPHQRTGAYLCENQGWERAFLRAWRKNGHGKIIGAAHSTVPFWHLYYFDDPRTLRAATKNDMPLPDFMAVNGAPARELLAAAGFPADRLVDVEALRYLGLSRAAPRRNPDLERLEILIMGDIAPASMSSLLSMVDGAVPLLPAGWKFTFKPHPVYPADLAPYPALANIARTNDALDRILGEFDVAIAANSTSAAVDAYQAGLPVIVALDGTDLNLSPLRGRPGARFAGTAEEMAAALIDAGRSASAAAAREEFFNLDPDLPRWRRLLA
ncbi:MAG: TIGR04326 family surface carbohydrate biosynthesis protein [Elusimicrobiota bacterium]